MTQDEKKEDAKISEIKNQELVAKNNQFQKGSHDDRVIIFKYSYWKFITDF